MRLWSVHPAYLDRQGLLACWREGLLAQAVLAGRTTGYTRHPQLERFRGTEEPRATIGAYLRGIQAEATIRGYRFDPARIDDLCATSTLVDVTAGQVAFEARHLMAKLATRTPGHLNALESDYHAHSLQVHPLFAVIPGGIEPWERAAPPSQIPTH